MSLELTGKFVNFGECPAGRHRSGLKMKYRILGVTYGSLEWSYTCVYLLTLKTHTTYFGFKQKCISKKDPYYDSAELIRKLNNIYEKPEKPSKMTKFQEELWKLCERCWTKPEERHIMTDIVGDLNSLKEV